MSTEPRNGHHPARPADTTGFQDDHAIEGRLLVALAKVGIALRSEAWKDAGARGLTPTQTQILVALMRSSGDTRLSEVAELLGVSAPTVSDSVRALERKGLVEKNRASDDGRALSLSLTRAGRKESEEVAEWPDLLLATVGTLDDQEQAVMLRAMVKVIRELQDRGRISPSRMCATCRYFQPYRHPDPLRPHHCGFVDAAFGDRNLRLECSDYEAAPSEAAGEQWKRFVEGSTR